jgi:hypothetical protein
MAQSDPSFSTTTTIYNYRLLKKIPHTVYMTVIYLALLLPLLAKNIMIGLWWLFVISYALVLLAHVLVVRIYFYFTVGGGMKGWSFCWSIFWNGILPRGHASIRLVQKVQLHLLWIGLILLGGLYAWLDSMLWVNLLFFHLWVILPRIFILVLFRPFLKSGLIRISTKDSSCYLP